MNESSSIQYYIINLPTATDRHESMQRQMEAVGANFQFITAISGQEVEQNNLPGYEAKKTKRYYNYELVPNEVACVMSHRKALQQFLDDGMEYGVVLEDDAQLLPCLNKGIQELIHQVTGWDVVKLELRGPSKVFPLCLKWGQDSILQPVFLKHFGRGATGFMYTRRAAEIILHDSERFFLPADALIADIILSRQLRVIAAAPPLLKTLPVPSTIDGEGPNRYELAIRKKYTSLIQKLRHFWRVQTLSLRKIRLYIKLLLCVKRTGV